MTKCSVAILGIIILHLISGTLTRPENFQLSEKQITKLREISTRWADVINFEENPCENFYDFLCSIGVYPKIEKNYTKNMLEDILNTKTELTETEQKYLKYSTTCGEFKEEEKEEFIKQFKLENSIGSWPAFVENWDDSKFNLQQAIAELNSYGYRIIFAQNLAFDENNFEPTLEIIKQYVVDITNQKDRFKSKLEKLGVINPEDVLTDAVLFEKKFKEATESLETATDKRIKFAELKDYLPEVDWNKQIEIIYGGKLPDNITVLIKNHEELRKIYEAISELSPKVIANYFFCAFVCILNDYVHPQSVDEFMPVIKQAFLKHVYDQNQKYILKGMCVTTLKTVQDWNIFQNFKTRYSTEKIAEIFDEEIFGLINEEDLANEFKAISSNSNECVRNYHHLQKIYKKRLAKPFLNFESNWISIIESEIIYELFYKFPKYMYIEDPSPFLFMATFSITRNVFKNPTFHSSETINCLSKQFAIELDEETKQHLFVIQLIWKTFAEWTKNYPKVVQEENKILQEYNLTSEKLFIIFTTKLHCQFKDISIFTALSNSPEYSKFFDCPLGSKMNAFTKCNF